MNKYHVGICVSLILHFSSCINKATSDINENINEHQIEISSDLNFFDDSKSFICDTSFVILHENEKTLFSDIMKMIAVDDRFYILDRFRARTVVAFDRHGNPICRYGAVGQGAGEYSFPSDLYVDETGVYVADCPRKKIIKYSLAGEYIEERSVPFGFGFFCKLPNENYLFNITPDGNTKDGLILTDSDFQIKKVVVKYPDEFYGGYYTRNVIRKINDQQYIYYTSPLDTIYQLNQDGEVKEKLVLDFKGSSVSDEYKKNFLRIAGNKSDYIMFADSPIEIQEGFWVGNTLSPGIIGTVFLDLHNNRSGLKRLPKDEGSVYDLPYMIGYSDKGETINLLDSEYETKQDFDLLPDSIQDAIKGGERVLILNKWNFSGK